MKRLAVIAIFAPAIIVVLAWLLMSESGLRWSVDIAKAWLPAQLSVEGINGRLLGPITIDKIDYQQDGLRVRAEHVSFDWNPAALLAAGLTIDTVTIDTIQLTVSDTGQPAAPGLPAFQAPLRIAVNDARIHRLDLLYDDQKYHMQNMAFAFNAFHDRTRLQRLSFSTDTSSFDISGKLNTSGAYRHRLDIDWMTSLPDHKTMTGTGRLQGDLAETRLTQQLRGPLQLTVEGTINNIVDQPDWQARIKASDVNLKQLNVDWPAVSAALDASVSGDMSGNMLSGNVRAVHDQTDTITGDFSIRQVPDQPVLIEHVNLQLDEHDLQLRGHGQWQPAGDGGEFKLDLNWKNLRWPIRQSPWFNSAEGSGQLSGTLDHYSINVLSDSPWPEKLHSQWRLQAHGNRDSLTVDQLQVDMTDGGKIVSSGRMDWSRGFAWQSSSRLDRIDPASHWPQWPGKLKGKVLSQGQIADGKLRARLDISSLSGQLRNYPLSLRSQIHWQDERVEISSLALRSGKSRLELSGHAGKDIDIKWKLASNNLAELYPRTSGTLTSHGSIDGSFESPRFDVFVNGRAIGLPDYTIGDIKGRASVDSSQWQQLNIDVAARAVNVQGLSFQSINIRADRDRLDAQLVTGTTSMALSATGTADAEGWHGNLDSVRINSSTLSNWQLLKPVAISVGADSLNSDPLCLQANAQAQVCVTLARQQDSWHGNLDGKAIPLKLFTQWKAPDTDADGIVNAIADVRFNAPGQLIGKLSLSLPAGTIKYPLLEAEREHWQYQQGRLDLVIDGSGITADAEIVMDQDNKLSAAIQLPEANPLTWNPRKQKIHARAKFAITDLGLLEILLPETQDIQGRISLDLAADGTVDQPIMTGNATLQQGRLQIPRLGLKISQIEASAHQNGQDKLVFGLQARSGEGTVTIDGHTQMDRRAGWPTTLRITGKHFEVSRIPEAHITIDPDLMIRLHGHNIDIGGNIHIPYARLQPKDTSRAARVSADAVIVGADTSPTEKWLITSRLGLTLGDRVHLYGFGFEGRLGGKLSLQDEPGQLTTAVGEINVPEGRYRAYGQRLEVEQGRLLFTGGPITNPGLDLRAVRRIDDITAGLKVRGTLSEPRMEIFSIPAMGQTEALSYLLLGRPIDSASQEDGAMMTRAALALGLSGGDRIARSLGEQFGLDEMRIESGDTGNQASLVLGRYLTPRLYISYGVGLIEAFNTLSIRYNLTDKWQLKGESGEHHSADILYTIRR